MIDGEDGRVVGCVGGSVASVSDGVLFSPLASVSRVLPSLSVAVGIGAVFVVGAASVVVVSGSVWTLVFVFDAVEFVPVPDEPELVSAVLFGSVPLGPSVPVGAVFVFVGSDEEGVSDCAVLVESEVPAVDPVEFVFGSSLAVRSFVFDPLVDVVSVFDVPEFDVEVLVMFDPEVELWLNATWIVMKKRPLKKTNEARKRNEVISVIFFMFLVYHFFQVEVMLLF